MSPYGLEGAIYSEPDTEPLAKGTTPRASTTDAHRLRTHTHTHWTALETRAHRRQVTSDIERSDSGLCVCVGGDSSFGRPARTTSSPSRWKADAWPRIHS